MVTLRDVARVAGVSVATVSRVLRNKGYLSPKTRRAVETAVKRTGYMVNLSASNLRTGKSGIIGIMMQLSDNPTFVSALRGLEETFRKEGYHSFFVNVEESASREKWALTYFIQRGVEGILVSSAGAPASFYRKTVSHIPVVSISRTIRGFSTDAVTVDAQEGIQSATQYLLSLGHTRIALLVGPAWLSTARARLRAFQTTLKKNNLRINDAMIQRGDITEESGYVVTRSVLQTTPRPTAILPTNHLICLGALRAVRDARLRIPQDISFIAFHDVEWLRLLEPPMTAITFPAHEEGVSAAHYLLDRILGRYMGPPRLKDCPVQLIIRESCGPV